MRRSSELWLSLVKLYQICCCLCLLLHSPLLLLWPGSRGWSWQHGCWYHNGCWRKRTPELHWCWLQQCFACCLPGCPKTSGACNADQEKQNRAASVWLLPYWESSVPRQFLLSYYSLQHFVFFITFLQLSFWHRIGHIFQHLKQHKAKKCLSGLSESFIVNIYTVSLLHPNSCLHQHRTTAILSAVCSRTATPCGNVDWYGDPACNCLRQRWHSSEGLLALALLSGKLLILQTESTLTAVCCSHNLISQLNELKTLYTVQCFFILLPIHNWK